MNVRIDTHIHTYIQMRVYVHTHTYVHIYIHTQTNTHTHTSTRTSGIESRERVSASKTHDGLGPGEQGREIRCVAGAVVNTAADGTCMIEDQMRKSKRRREEKQRR